MSYFKNLGKSLVKKAQEVGRGLEERFEDYVESPKGQKHMDRLKDAKARFGTYVKGDGGELLDKVRGDATERFKSNHSKVQVFMLENDDKTIATEVPIWLKNNELDDFGNIFNSQDPLTGHIDVLRIENDKIWVWDYKPNAQKEEFAMTQTYFYALMLSKRTGIDLDHFRCGYFDSCYAFIFKPEKDVLKEENQMISSFI